MVKNNPSINKVILFKKTHKLLNRILFLFFAENRGLLPPNSISSEYNGGLFSPDEILDTLVIDDSILEENTLKISSYDFSSDIDVNILGQLFENSLNETDEMHTEMTGAEFDKPKTRRKRERTRFNC